jgi:hypothetical protein
VPSKSNSYFLRSCSNFFCWLALRCLQLSLTTDWRSALLYLASRIHVACSVASCVLCGSMARLWLCLSARSMLEPCRLLMILIGKMTSSMVIILSLKFKMIPNSFNGHSANNEVILRPIILVIFDHIRLHMGPFAIRIFKVQLHPGFMLRLEDPIQSIL